MGGSPEVNWESLIEEDAPATPAAIVETPAAEETPEPVTPPAAPAPTPTL